MYVLFTYLLFFYWCSNLMMGFNVFTWFGLDIYSTPHSLSLLLLLFNLCVGLLSLFSSLQLSKFLNQNVDTQIKKFVLNFGPQHPASHGVLRLILQLQGEYIERSDANIGFLHRGTEKLIEQRIYIKSLPYFDRLDYVSMMTQEHSFCLAVEDLLSSTSFTAIHIQIRTLFDELTRLLNHYLGISTHSLDVGNMSPVFWAFEEREKLMEFYERVSGARMHAAFYRPNEINLSGVNSKLFLDIILFISNTLKIIVEIFTVLATNSIWKSRLSDIGVVSAIDVSTSGVTGVVARSAGLKSDLRMQSESIYGYYWFINMRSFLGLRGDSFDRFLIRVRELLESAYISNQLSIRLFEIFETKYSLKEQTLSFANFISSISKYYSLKYSLYTKNSSMEFLIEHFKYFSEGIRVPSGLTYKAVEAPKGEFGVSLISDGTEKPFRCKIRSPAYHHLQLMMRLIKGHYFVDMITVLGSLDIVFGEVDR